jgi:hemolysin activation/secretion protein/AraC-like DNA-binding protein
LSQYRRQRVTSHPHLIGNQVARHLIIQELSLRPSGEWKPDGGWIVVRMAEGFGYCLQNGQARELNAGDIFIAAPNASIVFRASQLGVAKLEFFFVFPQCLNGLLTVTESAQLETLSRQPAVRLLHFLAGENPAQKFARLAIQPARDSLSARAALLHLWAAAITGLLPVGEPVLSGNKLRERFRQFVGQMSEAELFGKSLVELAAQFHCSERHFSRLFREEFGIALRARQKELRLQRARQLLADSNAKIINVAYESGYRHLGLFNAMFKKRFGVTPSEWRQQNVLPSTQKINLPRRAGLFMALLLYLAAISHAVSVGGQTTNVPAVVKNTSTNVISKFTVEKYLVSGNSILPPQKIGQILTNVPEAFGTNVTFDDIRAQLGNLQMAYRERGFVTVSVGLPPQKLTNATVKIKVTEGRLAAINVTGNKYYSPENVLRALPELHTNLLLNSHVFQRELDLANANRDRQIYPVIGPGLELGTSALTLKVKDRFPLHARVELNNQSTPGTPDNRVAFSAQYDNLWNLEHQVGVQYTFSPLNYGTANTYYFSPLDLPLIANYSAYYRLPLGTPGSLQQQIDDSNGHFGYNEVTHQFVMPPPSGRPDLTVYANRSVTDSGIILGPTELITSPTNNLVQIGHGTAGENITLNEGIGFKFSLPLPQLQKISSTLTFGADYKHYQGASANADIFYELLTTTNNGSSVKFGEPIYTLQQPVRLTKVDYFPLNVGLSGSMPDSFGTSFFNAQANFNVATIGKLSSVAYTASAKDHYFTLQMGASREQRFYKDWTVLLHADGQWASTPLFSNEQYAMGGVSSVRGYQDGEAYGDIGWHVTVEPRTPIFNIGMVDGDVPFYLRGSVFMDYGEGQTLEGHASAFARQSTEFWGVGGSLTANIGSHIDARLTLALPLVSAALTSAGEVHVYFGVGAQF